MRCTTTVPVLCVIAWAAIAGSAAAPLVDAPARFWNDRELSDWATPVAGLNVRPGHFSEQAYYAAPEFEMVRTYPIYAPGREPAGYWDVIRNAKPEPLLTPGARTEAEWVAEGKRLFREMDNVFVRNYDPAVHEVFRSLEEFQKRRGRALQDGTIPMVRWVPTSKGLAVSQQACAGCHSRVMPDGTILDGAPLTPQFDLFVLALFTPKLAAAVQETSFPGDSTGVAKWRQFGVPWVADDIHERLKSMSPADMRKLGSPGNVIARFGGSPFYPTKVPDLIGIRDRKYIDHTATHVLRGPADLMRYAEIIGCCDAGVFGEYQMLHNGRILGRTPEHQLFALSKYLLALEPPRNPNADDPRAADGRKVFDREGCATCHTPPLYTNNKLTLAAGFTPPPDHPLRADIIPVSVGTDSNLALKTRKGTGLYKVPSLRGVWYRGGFNHDGSVNTLEEWFDAARLLDDYVPSGFKGYEITHRAVPGHPFGLKLNAEEKAALIAFLKTL